MRTHSLSHTYTYTHTTVRTGKTIAVFFSSHPNALGLYFITGVGNWRQVSSMVLWFPCSSTPIKPWQLTWIRCVWLGTAQKSHTRRSRPSIFKVHWKKCAFNLYDHDWLHSKYQPNSCLRKQTYSNCADTFEPFLSVCTHSFPYHPLAIL